MRIRRLLSTSTVALTTVAALATTGGAQAHGGGPAHPPAGPASAGRCSAAVGIDGFSDALDETSFGGTFVGNLSALAVDAHGTLDALSDRSALFTLSGHGLDLKPENVAPLADEKGQPLDSEAIVVDRDGTRLISSEAEPSIRRYSRDGTKILGSLPVPDMLRVAPAGRATTNLTFEGLALQPGGRTLVASMEGALSGDDTRLVRFQTWQRKGLGGDFTLGRQYAYHVDTDAYGSLLGVSDIAPAGDGRLLVLERGYTTGVGNTVRLYLADPSHATDVSGVTELTGQKNVTVMHKELLADIGACPSLGAPNNQPQPNPLLDNIEGMAVTGHTLDGRLRLTLVSDDNQSTTQITRLYALTARLPRH
ncbi:esterase-like activity of phytase family protein [Streptomyces sp. TS71-3]|uniref:esterase-like activity of phytase family protein n=1 Tax=Streptomyces sp. TS71-3 TaxID=2733862 RepID=UPI001B06CEAF|nr:esterase-like activity of phytase family protein [Streptomyces sp. TS71-3]GHJ41637.1 lipoprotein [Streptomyces sp. TS71-3]